MKKVIALVLAIIMMFSMTSVSYAVDNTVSTQTLSVVAANENSVSKIDNYMDYLEAKLDDQNTNFFVKIIVRLVIIGVMLGIINVKDFDEWFENTAPDTDTDNSGSNPPTDSSTNKDWEDGTELTLHPAQSLPYTQNGVTITNIKITKEHHDGLDSNNRICNYKYNVEIEGTISDYDKNSEFGFDISLHLENSPYTYGLIGDYIINEDGSFTFTGFQLTEYDSDRFSIVNVYYKIYSYDD